MQIHALTTGTVRITSCWRMGEGPYPLRLARSLLDPHLTDPLPIWCWLIEHPEGLILVDTGIPIAANDPVSFPPYMPLVRRAAPFQIASPDQEIGPQLRRQGVSPADVRWVILTHLHQDHEGGLHHFPRAQFLVSRSEWDAARGWRGRLSGYLNGRWPDFFRPHQVDFGEPDPIFGGRYTLTASGDVYLVPTPGHSAGHLSVVVQDAPHTVFIAGDASYSQDLLLSRTPDGVSPNAARALETRRRILDLAHQTPTVYLPSHEWAAQERLAQRIPLPLTSELPVGTL